MMSMLFVLPGNEAMGRQLAPLIGATFGSLELRQFPDGETYVRLRDDVADREVLILCTLSHPDPQLPGLIFAADAARELGARSITLIAPYLAYMRQDKRFRPGEAISSRSFARILSCSFDRIITICPHLHRYPSLSEIYPIDTVVLDATPLLAAWIATHVETPFLLGPDRESEQWVAQVAQAAGIPFAICDKRRHGDRVVTLDVPMLSAFAGRQPVIVDDIISSGTTLAQAAINLHHQGFLDPVCVVVHDLLDPTSEVRFKRLVTTDSASSAHAEIPLAPLIAQHLIAARYRRRKLASAMGGH